MLDYALYVQRDLLAYPTELSCLYSYAAPLVIGQAGSPEMRDNQADQDPGLLNR